MPVVGGAAAYKLLKVARQGFPPGMCLPFAVGMLAAAPGFFAVWFLVRYVRTHDFRPFAIYRFLIGAGVLLVILLGLRPAAGL